MVKRNVKISPKTKTCVLFVLQTYRSTGPHYNAYKKVLQNLQDFEIGIFDLSQWNNSYNPISIDVAKGCFPTQLNSITCALPTRTLGDDT